MFRILGKTVKICKKSASSDDYWQPPEPILIESPLANSDDLIMELTRHK